MEIKGEIGFIGDLGLQLDFGERLFYYLEKNKISSKE